ncbi:MAG: hypothetical protein ACO1TE_18710 [Prosthecobacter sp.]
MSPIPSLAQLKQAVQLCEQIEKLQLELEALLSSTRSALTTTPKAALLKQPRRVPVAVTGTVSGSRVSAQGSQRIAAAQRRRWARFRRARKEAAEQGGNGSLNGNSNGHGHGHANGSHKSIEDSAAEN